MEIKITPQQSTSNSSVVTWWCTGQEAGATSSLSITQKDRLSISNLPQNAKILSVRSETGDPQSKPQSRNDWSYKQSFSAYLPPSNNPQTIDRIVIELSPGGSAQVIDLSGVKVDLTLSGQKYSVTRISPPPPAQPPKIEGLCATPSIVTVNSPFFVQWKPSDASSWELSEAKTIISRQTLKPAQSAVKVEGGKGQQLQFNSTGYHRYTVKAYNDTGATAEAGVALMVLNSDSDWQDVAQPWKGKVTRLCVGTDRTNSSEILYAVVRSEGANQIWSTADGFSGWTCLDVNVPTSVLTSPVAALPTEKKPVLVFAGGSAIDFVQRSNSVSLLDLNSDPPQWKPSYCATEWSARAGHVCLVAPDKDGQNKLWVMGGLDERGNTLHDAWFSATGEKGSWYPRDISGIEARYLFAAAARGPEIWLAGGFPERNGPPLNEILIFKSDIAKLDTKGTIPEDGWRTSGVALTVLHGRVYLIGTQLQADKKQSLFTPDSLEQSSGSFSAPLPQGNLVFNDSPAERRIEAVAFNGAIWVFSLYPHSQKHDVIEVSELKYHVPVLPADEVELR